MLDECVVCYRASVSDIHFWLYPNHYSLLLQEERKEGEEKEGKGGGGSECESYRRTQPCADLATKGNLVAIRRDKPQYEMN